jgi:hypothetical protein
MRQHAKILAFLALAALASSALGCSISGTDVVKVSAAFKPADSSSYTLADVNEHFKNMNGINFVSNTDSTYTCVDARGDEAYLSTPG